MIVIRRVVVQRLRIVAVNTFEAVGCWSAENSLDTTIRRACGVNPAVFYITATGIGYSCRGERSRNAEVIDITAEVSEQ